MYFSKISSMYSFSKNVDMGSSIVLKDELEEPPFTKPFFDNKAQGAFDIKSYAAAVLKKDFTDIHRDTYPKDLHDNTKHTHKAIDDAREYAQLLIKLLDKK